MIWLNETLLGSLSRPQTYANIYIYIPVHIQWAPYFQVHDTYLHMITRRRCVCVCVLDLRMNAYIHIFQCDRQHVVNDV